jgi:hypothetical protein
VSPRGVLRALRQKLGELGYVEGRDIVFEIRAANEDFERLPELAADLVRANVDVIVAVSPPAIRAAEIATTTILIVMAFSGTDPGASVSGATLDLLASPLAAGAQQAGRMPRIGVLLPAEPASPTEPMRTLRRHSLSIQAYCFWTMTRP